MTNASSLQRPDLVQEIADLRKRISQLERLLQGQPVGTARVQDLRWDKGRGGTITLGGEGNGNGVLQILNALNTQRVLMDNSGILINDGALTIKDENDTTIIDSSGLVSASNFSINLDSGAPFAAFTSTTYADLTTPIQITIPRATKALVSLSVISATAQINAALDCNGRTYYKVESDIDGPLAVTFYDSFLTAATNVRENIISKPYSIVTGYELSPGTHNISVQGSLAFNTNLTSNLNYYDLAVILLGN